MQNLSRLAAIAAMAVLVFAGSAMAQQKMEVIHWMNGEANAKKLAIVAAALKAQGIEWVDNAVAAPDDARSLILSRITSGDPPTVAMYNSGGPLKELASQGVLRNLDDIAKEMDWQHLVSPTMWEAMNYNGHVYSVPFNMQALNWIWYNVADFKELGLEPPKTWEDVLADSKKFEAAGKIGLVAGKEDFPIIHLFGSTLANIAGPDVYRAIYTDHSMSAAKSTEALKWANMFVKIVASFDPGANGRTWQDAQNLVLSGKAAMQHMGDWYKGGILSAGLTPGKEIGCIVGPGKGLYFTDANSFVMPKSDDPGVIKAQDAFARTLMSKEVQVATAKVDSGTPARLDVDASTLDLCAQAGIKAMLDPTKSVPADTFATDGFDFDGSFFDVAREVQGNPKLTGQDVIDRIVKILVRFPKPKF